MMRKFKAVAVALTVVAGVVLVGGGAAAEPLDRQPVEVERGDRSERRSPASVGSNDLAPASHHGGSGYWMVDMTGSVYDFGAAAHRGQPSDDWGYPSCEHEAELGYCDYVIDIEATPSGNGYWVLDTVGFVWGFGGAPRGQFQTWTNDPWMSITATSDGGGLWAFSSMGCVETLGNAVFHGDMCEMSLNAPIVGSAVTPSGGGYYLVAADGGIFSFGDAAFHGSTGSMRLNQPVTDMVVTSTGNGYWLVALDGGIFAFGDAGFHGSMGSVPLNRPVSGMVASPTGAGYLMVAEDGGIFSFGDVPFHGSLGSNPPAWPVVAVTVR